jgi:hypothetical protein
MVELQHGSLKMHVTTFSVYKMHTRIAKCTVQNLRRLDPWLGRTSSPSNKTVVMVATTPNILLCSFSIWMFTLASVIVLLIALLYYPVSE